MINAKQTFPFFGGFHPTTMIRRCSRPLGVLIFSNVAPFEKSLDTPAVDKLKGILHFQNFFSSNQACMNTLISF